MENVVLIGGRSNPKLTNEIAEVLHKQPLECDLSEFHNGETKVLIHDKVGGRDVFILQTNVTNDIATTNTYFIELQLLIDAAKRAGCRTVTVIIPFFFYSRSDKKDHPRCPIGAAMICNNLNSQNVTRIVSVDLHASQIQGFATCPFDNLFVVKLFTDYISSLFELNGKDRYFLISPDGGSTRRIRDYAKRLHLNYVTMDKCRDYEHPGTVIKSQIIGDVSIIEGRIGIMIDDMIDTFETANSALCEVIIAGAESVIVMTTHGILSKNAVSLINDNDYIRHVVVTDSIPQTRNKDLCPKLEVVNLSGFLAETISCIAKNKSLHHFFE